MAKPEELEKFMDEGDESFTGFCCLQILDQDGYPRKTRGSAIEAPLFFEAKGGAAGAVVLEAEFAADPLFYLQVANEEGVYLYGQWWTGAGGWCRTNQIGAIIPKETNKAHSEIGDKGSFVADVEIPFLQNAGDKLAKATFSVKEQRFVTKVVKVSLEIPADHWQELKRYRSKLWQSWKVWGGKDANEKKKDEKKDAEAAKAA